MGIREVHSVGLQIDMVDYVRLHPSRSAPDFWYPNHQEVLRKLMAPFLPRMTYDASSNTVTASVIENGKELLSESKDSSTAPIPDKLLRELDELVRDLKSKVDTEVMDPDTRSLLRAFKLPDPKKSPELYRIYGDKRHPRLAILWGMEKHVGSSISVMDMNVSKNIHTPNRSGKGKWLAILLALAAGGIVWFCIDRANKQAEAERIRIAEEEARLKAEEEARLKAEEEARLKAERLKALEEEYRIKVKLWEEGGALPPSVSVSENLPFFVEKVKQEARRDGRINITLKLIPKDGTSFRRASINNIKVNPQTWQVLITITSKSQKVPVEVYVKGRKTPYSVDCTINISDNSLNSPQ